MGIYYALALRCVEWKLGTNPCALMVKSGINVLVMISDGLEIRYATVSTIIELSLVRTAIKYRQFGGIGGTNKNYASFKERPNDRCAEVGNISYKSALATTSPLFWKTAAAVIDTNRPKQKVWLCRIAQTKGYRLMQE